MARPLGLDSVPAFGPIAGAAPVEGAEGLPESPARFHPLMDLLIGTTRDEMRAFFDSNPNIAMLRRVPGVGRRAHDLLTAKVTERVFAAPAAKLADAQAAAGGKVYRYRFDWAPPSGGFGACHTLDLPFVFGARDAWSRAPMLGAVPWETLDVLGDAMRAAWTSSRGTATRAARVACPGPRTGPGPRWAASSRESAAPRARQSCGDIATPRKPSFVAAAAMIAPVGAVPEPLSTNFTSEVPSLVVANSVTTPSCAMPATPWNVAVPVMPVTVVKVSARDQVAPPSVHFWRPAVSSAM